MTRGGEYVFEKVAGKINQVEKLGQNKTIRAAVFAYKLDLLENSRKYEDRAHDLRVALCDELLAAILCSQGDNKKLARKLRVFLDEHKEDRVQEKGRVFSVHDIALEILDETIKS